MRLHARNALPQRAQANVNCRMFPGESVEKVRGQIAERLGYRLVDHRMELYGVSLDRKRD